jgi:hypothetical protein
MRYGNSLGRAMEVDVPSSEQDMNEFLRVRVDLPYSKRLQTQLTVGVKGRPDLKVFKLRYERVPYYCAHCGFMGHRKDTCEKKRLGVPSLDYEAHEIRCSPYKKFENHAHFLPPAGHASARRGMSFSSFGSAESHKSARASQNREASFGQPQHQHHMQEGDNNDLADMPPLEDILPGTIIETVPVGACDGFDGREEEAEGEVEQNLLSKIDDMQVEAPEAMHEREIVAGSNTRVPIIQFPDEETPPRDTTVTSQGNLSVSPELLKRMQQVPGLFSDGQARPMSPHLSDMIPAMQGLSNLQVSFGSATDVTMSPADSVLGKHAAGAEEEEVQGQRLDLSLGLNLGSDVTGGQQKRGRKQTSTQTRTTTPTPETQEGKQKMTTTGHVKTGNQARSRVWLRQEK